MRQPRYRVVTETNGNARQHGAVNSLKIATTMALYFGARFPESQAVIIDNYSGWRITPQPKEYAL